MASATLPTHIAVVALVRDARVLLAHRHPNRMNYPDLWDLPGGHVEPGESAECAARRECVEELGVTVIDAERFPMACSDPALLKHAFFATRWVGNPRNIAPDEHDDIGWFAESELPRLAMADPAGCQDLVRLMRAIK
ncbi:NUDIX domain-containing protein [Dermacoccus nishinomiyaensis]|uniref:NUDIX hydrolase n=1 Tax=Dermacoccus TaxID=57495 RepID=UPI00093DF0ED|nr:MULTISPECIES: NUDIX domain-containing protein [Dermacoccus]MBO1757281.1 NUDIX domain-containing protein [Dermacoccus sp. NHGro5]TCJ91756.1 ADP-ribose pyrophosphatase YjhB (NUDIX family) [Dermacoccus sp. SAI-028]TJZ97252.1 NUDIX domain-containing protein [Dermacoccus nishinomiyaensis]